MSRSKFTDCILLWCICVSYKVHSTICWQSCILFPHPWMYIILLNNYPWRSQFLLPNRVTYIALVTYMLFLLGKAPFPVSFGSNCQRWKHFYDQFCQWEEEILQTKHIEIILVWPPSSAPVMSTHSGGKGANWTWNSFDLGSNVGNCFQMRLGNRPNLSVLRNISKPNWQITWVIA